MLKARTLSAFVLAAALLFPLAAFAGPQQADMAHGKKVSDRVITWTQELPNGQTITLREIEGQMARISDSETGYHYGLIPVVTDAEKQEVKITVFEIRTVEGAGEALREVDHIMIEPGSVGTGEGETSLVFRLDTIAEPKQ